MNYEELMKIHQQKQKQISDKQTIAQKIKRRFGSKSGKRHTRSGITLNLDICPGLINQRIREKKKLGRHWDNNRHKYIDFNNEEDAREYFNLRMDECKSIVNKEWRVHRSCFAYRLDSNFTNLPARIRNNLKLDDEDSTEIDIKSAQPSFLWTILNQQNTDQICKVELEAFKNKLHSDMYIEFSNLWNMPRNDAKVHFLSWIMAPINSKKYKNVRQYFEQAFPTLLQVIEKIKSIGAWYTDDDKERESHKYMSHLLQRFESEFMIDTVCPQILTLRPKFSFFTVHDAIYVPKSKAQIVLKIINDELIKQNTPTHATIK